MPSLTEGGAVAPITWIGSRRVDCSRHTDATRIWPVLIRAGAFAPGRPKRDLFLSPDHAIFAAGVLIPVKHLVNGRSILQVAADEVVYFHVELAQHAVILAEGLAVESYLDTGDRSAFTGTRAPRMLHPVFGSERADIALVMEALGCAPLRVTGPEVAQTRALLARRTLRRCRDRPAWRPPGAPAAPRSVIGRHASAPNPQLCCHNLRADPCRRRGDRHLLRG